MPPLKRYHRDDGTPEPTLKLAELQRTVHALYTHWVAAHAHRRDFACAMAHAADMCFIDFVLAARPNLAGEQIPLKDIALAVPRGQPAQGPALRFYNDNDELNPAIDVSQHIPALGPLFVGWVQDGFAPRDFALAVADTAKAIAYSHHLAEQLGGLGGGKDGKAFLTTAFRA